MPSVFGETLVTLLKMLMRTRKRVTSRAILPGTTWVIDTDMREVVMVVMVWLWWDGGGMHYSLYQGRTCVADPVNVTSGGIRKLTQDVITKRAEGR